MKNSRFICFVSIFAVLLSGGIRAQQTISDSGAVNVKLLVRGSDRQVVEKVLPFKDRRWANDSMLDLRTPAQFLLRCQEQGWLTASLDTMRRDSTIHYRFYAGPRWYWAQLTPADAVSSRWLQAAQRGSKSVEGAPVRPSLWVRQQQRMLEMAENAGYPFFRAGLEQLVLDSSGGVQALIVVNPGTYITFNDLKINGEVNINRKILSRHFDIKKGAPYSREKIMDIARLLKSLPYLEQYAAPTIHFSGQQATVNLWLKKKRAGRFDFVVGLLPPAGNQPDGRLTITGSLNALLLNALGQGERLSVEIDRLRPQTQTLQVQASAPYIAGSPFGADGRLNIYRRDSTWVDVQGNLGAQYYFRGGKGVLFWENRSSSLQKIDTLKLQTARQLPSNLDFRQNGAGLESEWGQTDDRYNPRKGWNLRVRASVSEHRILRNPQIDQLTIPGSGERIFSMLYDSMTNTRQMRLRGEWAAEWYVPVAGRLTTLWRARAAGVSGKVTGSNEQYRIGGHKLLRGFDEESIFATRWAVFTAELRLLLGQNAYMAVFTDYGYVENITASVREFQRPWGVGAGMTFETSSGLFGISAAAGRGNPGEGFGIRASRIHIGYVSQF